MPFRRGVINPWRVIGDHELFLFTRGEARMSVEGEVFSCPEGSWLIIPPARRHLSECLSATVHVRWMHFTWGAGAPVGKLTYLPGPGAPVPAFAFEKPRHVPKGLLFGRLGDPQILEHHDSVAAQLRSGDARRCRLARARFLEELLGLLDPPREEDAAGEPLSHRVRRRLDEVAGRPANEQGSIQQVLAGLGRSYAHLERCFHREFQVHPLRYLATARMRRAAALLEETSLSVAAVARDLGYDDAAYFSRLFRKRMGRSPARWRG